MDEIAPQSSIARCGTVDWPVYRWILFAQFLETLGVAEREGDRWKVLGNLNRWETMDGQMVIETPSGAMVVVPDWWWEGCDEVG